MTRYVQGKDGKMAGSIGDGKTSIPTASNLPPAGPSDNDPSPTADYAALHAAYLRQNYFGPDFRTGTPGNPVPVRGTGMVGDVRTDYATLERIFGQPLSGDGYKTTTEWHVEFTDENGEPVIATIYDWKNYDFDDEVTRPVGEYDWMVGGNDARAADLVRQALHSLYPTR